MKFGSLRPTKWTQTVTMQGAQPHWWFFRYLWCIMWKVAEATTARRNWTCMHNVKRMPSMAKWTFRLFWETILKRHLHQLKLPCELLRVCALHRCNRTLDGSLYSHFSQWLAAIRKQKASETTKIIKSHTHKGGWQYAMAETCVKGSM